MKKVNIKNYLILALVSFLSLVGYVKADTTYTLPLNDTRFISKSDYTGLKCVAQNFKAFTLVEDNNKYTITYTNATNDTTPEKLVCSWDKKNIAGGSGYEPAGSTTYSFVPDTTNKDYIVVYIGDQPSSTNYTVDIKKELSANKIISSQVLAEGGEYITANCSGETVCTVTPTELAKQVVDSSVISYLDVKYLDSNGVQRNTLVKIVMNISVWARAYPGDVGTCTFSSDWTNKSWTSEDYTTYNFYQSKDNNATLPSCTPNKNTIVPVTFKGWTKGHNSNSKLMAIGECSGALPAGTKVENYENYSACYESQNMVQLVLTEGSISNLGNPWQTSSSMVYFATANDSSTSYALPSVTFSGYNKKSTFVAWENQSTRVRKQPGESVPVDGSVWIGIVELKTTVQTSHDKTIYVGDEVILSSSMGYATNCTSRGPTVVKATYTYGSCVLQGLQASGDTPVEVPLFIDGYADPIIYRVTVLEKRGSGPTGGGGGGDDEFIIDVTPGVDYENVDRGDDGKGGDDEEGGSSDEFGDMELSTCTEFDITPKSGTRQYYGYARNYHVNGVRYTARSTSYTATPAGADCDKNLKYAALCMDPGRRGPGEGNGTKLTERYVKVYDIQADEPLGALMGYIVQNYDLDIFDQPANISRIGAHVSARIVFSKEFMTATPEAGDAVYSNAYYLFKDLAAGYQYNMSADQVGQVLENNLEFSGSNGTNALSVSGTAVKSEVSKILSEFYKENDGTSSAETQFSREMDTEATAQGNGYKLVHTGTITFPSGAVGVAGIGTGIIAPTKCANYGVTCKVDKWNKTGGSADGREVWEYQITITAANAANVKIPRTENQKKEVSFEIKYTGAGSINSIMLTQPQGSAVNLQRMLVIALDEPSVFAYFPIIPDECLDIGPLNPDNCTAADNCSPANFNKELFKEAGCCEQITDEEKYAYVFNAVCGGECTTSTMVEICEYSAENVGKADLYEIKEGTRYEGGAHEGDSGVQYSYDLGACVANVQDEYNTNGGLSSNSEFELHDDVGEIRNVPEYKDNLYCQVTCREDWQISMDAFGNFVGKNAVAAGTYFQIVNNDVFMSGRRFCYTSYLHYDQYMDDLEELSQTMVNAYNEHSVATHIWTNINNATKAKSLTCSPNTYYTGHYCKNECTGGRVLGVCQGWSYNCYATGAVSNQVRTCTLSTANSIPDNDKNDGTYKHYELEILKDAEDEDGDEFQVANGVDKDATERKNYSANKTSECEPHEVGPYGDNDLTYIRSYSGDCTTSEDAQFSKLQGEMKDEAERDAQSALSTMQSAKREIEQRAEDFFECQYFQFKNVTENPMLGSNNIEQLDDIVLGKSKTYMQIPTAFDPTASYEYDEEGFMYILKKNEENYLEVFEKRNDEKLGSSYTGAEEDTRVELKDGKTGDPIKTPSGDQVYLSKNYTEEFFYNPEERWKEEEGSITNFNTYGETDTGSSKKREDRGGKGGENADNKQGIEKRTIVLCDVQAQRDGEKKEWTSEPYDISGGTTTEYKASEGGCYTYVIEYVSTHYISSSIENSSYYKNQGFWYQSYGVDMKEHGKDKSTALQNAKKRGTDYFVGAGSQNVEKRWGLYGEYNVFPISMTTPRGLYQYEYSFFNVGVYPGDSTASKLELGRVMGFNQSIIKMNTRTCFYEVFEEVCLCCGDELNVHYDSEDYVVEEFLGSYSGPYNFDQSLLDEIISGADGTISIATSSVSLGNVFPNSTGGAGGAGSSGLASGNWSDDSPFLYNGNNDLTTSKGAHLLQEIESKGESIYNNTDEGGVLNAPEYSFYLTPSTLTSIREYNDKNGYEVNYNNMKVYGRYTISSDSSDVGDPNWGEGMSDAELDEHITFVHFGSLFLEDFMEPYTFDDSISKFQDEDSNVCTIEGNPNNFKGKELNKLVREKNCRWVDYIETGNGTKYRLAFK